jgi:hypothetical protein
MPGTHTQMKASKAQEENCVEADVRDVPDNTERNENLETQKTGKNRIKWIVLLLLVVQNVAVVLVMKKASKVRADDQRQALTTVIVFMV